MVVRVRELTGEEGELAGDPYFMPEIGGGPMPGI
jgi:hypothetical protein